MPSKAKAQPPAPDRVTRSKRTMIPEIPLPPRRGPPARKQAVSVVPFGMRVQHPLTICASPFQNLDPVWFLDQ